MASLTQTAYVTRKLINISIFLIVAGIIGKVAYGYAYEIWLSWFPPAPTPATVAFGPLPYPTAQNDIATPSGITYRLETIDNSLPTFPINVKVFHMPRPGPAFGSFQRMSDKASGLGFTDTPKKIASTSWRFVDPTNPLRTLDIDEISGNFRLTYNYLSDLPIFVPGAFSSEDQALSVARAFLNSASSLPKDYSNGTPSAFLLRLSEGAFVPASSLSNTEAIAITLNREDIEGLPVVSPAIQQGLVSAIVSSSTDRSKQILDGRFLYTEIDRENWATYPIITATDAFEQLRQGNAIYASVPNQFAEEIPIRKVFLAYLDPYPPQPYLQPVIVFSDDQGFVAYVPAITKDWLVK